MAIPWGQSFNAAIRDAVMDALKGREHALLDLYADGFDPAVREADLAALFRRADKRCPGPKIYGNPGPDTRIIYIYPVWWGTEPAIVKGFHDKVLLKDFAWSYSDDGSLLPKLKIEKNDNLQHVRCSWRIFAAYFNDYLPSHIFAARGHEQCFMA